MCDGSVLSNSSGGIRKPVALVRMVNSRKIAVSPGWRFEPSIPNITMMPATIPIRLMTTCTRTNVAELIPSIMMPRPSLDTRPEVTTQRKKLPHASVAAPATLACVPAHDRHQPKSQAASNFCRAVINGGRHFAPFLAIEKFDQFRDHLIGRLLHQPVAAALDQDALDIARDHPALLDQELAAGLFA